MDDLEDALEVAVMQVLDGSPPGPLFASRVRRVVLEVLRRRGLDGEVITAGGGAHVIVRLRDRQRVREIRVAVTGPG